MADRDPGSLPLDVEALFDDFLARLEEGESIDFEGFVASHPEHAATLRELYADWETLDAQLETAFPAPLAEGSLVLETFDATPGSGSGTTPGSGSGTSTSASSERGPGVDVRAGQVLADYRLVRRIGQGGMGQVWEAEQLSLRRRVALKLIRPDRAGDSVVLRFGREARAGGRVDHAGIVSVFAAGEVDGIHFIAMQFVDGEDLSDLIARMRDEPRVHGADYRRIAALFADVADAVNSAHRAGILHRDIKPQNILLGPDGSPKVTDFGLAYLADEAARQALPGLVGTYPYMSPEQAAGKDVVIDGRSDVFSLGAVLYEVLTLRRAFEGDSGDQILQRVLEHEPPDPRTVRSRVPGDLAVICMKALAKNRNTRYASMGAFADDLRRFLRNEPILARPPGVVSRATKWVARHPAWGTGLGLGTLLLAVVSVLLLREFELRRTAEVQRDRADTNARTADENARLAEDRAEQYRSEAYRSAVRAAAMHLDRGHHAEARELLATCAPERRGWEWYHDALQADLSLFALDSGQDPVDAVAASPDGSLLASGLDGGAVLVWDGVSGVERTRWIAHAGRVSALAWLPGDLLASAGDDGRVVLRDVRRDVQLAVFDGMPPITALAAAGDGSLLAAGADTGVVVLLDPRAPDAAPRRVPVDPGTSSLALDGAGTLLASASHYGTVSLWKTEDGSQVVLPLLPWYRGHTRVAISSDGTRLVTGADDGRITVWDVPSGLRVAELFGHDYPVSALALSSDGSRLSSLSADDGALLLWRRLDDLDALWSPTHDAWELEYDAWEASLAPAGSATSGDATPSGTDDDTTSDDGTASDVAGDASRSGATTGDVPAPPDEPPIVVWDARSGRRVLTPAAQVQDDGERLNAPFPGSRATTTATGRVPATSLTGQDGRVLALALSADGSRVAAGSSGGRTLVWDGETRGAAVTLPGPSGLVTSLAISSDGTRMVTASPHELVLRVWDGATGALVNVLEGHTIGVTDVDVSHDGARIVSTSYDDTLRVWDGTSGEMLLRLEMSGEKLGTVALDPSGALVYLGMSDGSIRVLDTTSGEQRASFNGHRSPVDALAVSDDGSVVASASSDGALRVWNGVTGEGRWLRAGGHEDDGLLALSADGRRVAWGSTTRPTVRVWDTRTGQPLSVLTGGFTGTAAVALSPDGRRVVSASWSNPTLRVWDADTGDVLALLTGHADTITALAATSDGGRIVSAGRDGALVVWESRLSQARTLWHGVARDER
ncbi:MAG: protein kinase [Planctomycetes bacterium]|nr:protein kinase [Planctomycetota bacterium]